MWFERKEWKSMQRSYNNHTFKVKKNTHTQSELLKMEPWGRGKREMGNKSQSWKQRAEPRKALRWRTPFLSGFHDGKVPHSCSERTLGPFSPHPTALCSNFCPRLTFPEPLCEYRVLCGFFNPQNMLRTCFTMTELRGPEPGNLTLAFAV